MGLKSGGGVNGYAGAIQRPLPEGAEMEGNKTLRWILLVGLLAGGGFMVKLMYDMTRNMERMTGYVGEMSGQVAQMSGRLEQMNGHVETMS